MAARISEKLLQKVRNKIQAEPNPRKQKQIIEEFTRDYPGLREALKLDVNFAEEIALKDRPKGGLAGSPSNPFAYAVAASPFEHLAGEVERQQAYKMRNEGRESLDKLSEQLAGTQAYGMEAGLFPGGMESAQAQALRVPRLPLRPEDEEEERKRLMGIPSYL